MHTPDAETAQERQKTGENTLWKRDDITKHVRDFEDAKSTHSQRQWAKRHGIPRSTLQYWETRKQRIDASEEVIAFFESPVGLAFLHRLITAAHVEFTKHGIASIHNVAHFFELAGIAPFIATSYGACQKVSSEIDALLIAFEQQEQQRLRAQMPQKKISICEDETFHPEVCLVAIEPRSNYILLESYAPNRRGETWNHSLDEALSGLPVEVIQSASDEGRGLLNHVEQGLQVHHSPDTFHVTHEIIKGTSGALSSAVKQAEKQHEHAVHVLQHVQERTSCDELSPPCPHVHCPDAEPQIEAAQRDVQHAEAQVHQARHRQEVVRTATKTIGQVYHPYDLLTGIKQEAHQVEARLEQCFKDIQEATTQLSERCQKHLTKAHRVVDKMTATMTFFFFTIRGIVEELALSPLQEQWMYDQIIPGLYLQRVARLEDDPTRKVRILQRSQACLSSLHDRDGPFGACDDEQLRRIERVGHECAQVFQRSSSCVEGRNAQLSLRHQSLHRLSTQKLHALTVIHNYYLKRDDGTTAAERFFEAKPNDLFEWLVDHLDFPARPRRHETKAA